MLYWLQSGVGVNKLTKSPNPNDTTSIGGLGSQVVGGVNH